MPQMSPMNWLLLCLAFLFITSSLKSMINIGQKNSNQKYTLKNSIKNNIKW